MSADGKNDVVVPSITRTEATITITTEQVDAAVARTAKSWTVRGYVKKIFSRPGRPDAGITLTKSWPLLGGERRRKYWWG